MKWPFTLIVITCLHQYIGAQDDNYGNYTFINGIKMYYEIHGTGEPLILLHGFFQTADWWEFSIKDLSKQLNLSFLILEVMGGQQIRWSIGRWHNLDWTFMH